MALIFLDTKQVLPYGHEIPHLSIFLVPRIRSVRGGRVGVWSREVWIQRNLASRCQGHWTFKSWNTNYFPHPSKNGTFGDFTSLDTGSQSKNPPSSESMGLRDFTSFGLEITIHGPNPTIHGFFKILPVLDTGSKSKKAPPPPPPYFEILKFCHFWTWEQISETQFPFQNWDFVIFNLLRGHPETHGLWCFVCTCGIALIKQERNFDHVCYS